MVLSKYVPSVLGMDSTSSTMLMLYEYHRGTASNYLSKNILSLTPASYHFFAYFSTQIGRSIYDLLKSKRLTLDEKNPLFQHWSREILACLYDVCSMSTFSFKERITLKNFIVTHNGCGIYLAHVDFQKQITSDRYVKARGREGGCHSMQK